MNRTVVAALAVLAVVLSGNRGNAAQFAYVADLTGTVAVVDLATNTVVATVDLPAGGASGEVAIAPDGKRVYATGGGFPGTLSVIDVTTHALDGPAITVGNAPRGIAVTPDGKFAYVANFFDAAQPFGSSTVSVVDTATRAVVTTIPVGFEPVAVAILHDGSRAYVTNAGDGTVSVIDVATRIVIGSAIRVEDNPQGIAASPDSTRVYVTNFNSHSVSVIETASNTVVGTIQVGFVPYGVAVTPDGRQLYVVDNGSVAVIDAETQTLTTRVTLPPFNTPRRIAVSADGARAYVTINTPPSLLIVDTATNAVIGAPIQIIGIPEGIAITPPASRVVPFRAFHVAVHHHTSRDALLFAAEGWFVLGRGSDGVHPDREAVTVSVSTRDDVIFTQTLPPGAFHFTRRGTLLFRPVQPTAGIEEMQIRSIEHGRFVVDVRGRSVLLARRRGPFTMSLQIGNDGGTGDTCRNENTGPEQGGCHAPRTGTP